MARRRTNNRTQLTGEQREQLRHVIGLALDPNGAPIKLAEIVQGARDHLSDDGVAFGSSWDFYSMVSDELQRMKRIGLAILVKGAGGGWSRRIEVGHG